MEDANPGDTGRNQETEEKLTPAMRQYRDIKSRHPDTILFFHIGDFYETFGSDAELVSRELDIVLTSRSKSGPNRVPLAGVPYHAAEGYIAKLVGKGYKVAVCDQVEDSKNVKGIVKREVVRVITPGTVIDPGLLSEKETACLMAICPDEKAGLWGIGILDISTGEFFASSAARDLHFQALLSEIARYKPAECLVPPSLDSETVKTIRSRGITVTPYREEAFANSEAQKAIRDHFRVASLDGYGCGDVPAALSAAGAALAYAKETQNTPLTHVSGLSFRSSSQSMILDAITLRNLEITESIRGKGGATLFSCLDRTRTPMGKRLLHRRLIRPLIDVHEIGRRLDSVECLVQTSTGRLALMACLFRCADIERIAGRIAYGNAGPRDLLALADSLTVIPEIRSVFASVGKTPEEIGEALSNLHELPDIVETIRKAIVDDPPAIARNGGVIRPGWSHELDEIARILSSGRNWIADLEAKERERTGIKSLKIGYNRIFGYYIDVTKPNLKLVPPEYERKQTTATGERYTLPSLKEKELVITNADERIVALEREIYVRLLSTLHGHVPALQQVAAGLAVLDVSASLAEVAQIYDYGRPQLTAGDAVILRDGRHPVVEQGIQFTSAGFVPNDAELSGSGTQIVLITGANMAGKSTYMRSVALICIMAQAGSFVPARYASIGVVDRVFTRVGAFDDLASGQSTFFVEMLELANIVNNVTERSLIILDEIGRGTSTVDGCSIARAVLEFLHGKGQRGPKTLFATHFHELIGMEEQHKRMKNFHFAVHETGSDVIFLRKLIPGATDRSYGIHVARIAGIPKKITDRAEVLLADSLNRGVGAGAKPQRYTQILLCDPHNGTSGSRPPARHPVLSELNALDPDTMTPLEALSRIADLKRKAGNGENEES
jgi:DNA mismatch repair protein MutS